MVPLFWEQVSWRGNKVSDFSLLAKPYLQISMGGTWKRSIPSLFFMLFYVLSVLLFWTLPVLPGMFLRWE